MKYAITKNETGETRIYEDAGDYNYEFMWTEGNYACDCNRQLLFERAAGNEPPLEDTPQCGHILYGVEFIVEDLL